MSRSRTGSTISTAQMRESSRLLEDIPRRLWTPALEAARAAFGLRNAFGVRAYGIGPCVRRGRRLPASALNVYVLRKHDAPRLEVPELIVSVGRKTWCVRPNVIATGKRPRAVAGGAPQFSG